MEKRLAEAQEAHVQAHFCELRDHPPLSFCSFLEPLRGGLSTGLGDEARPGLGLAHLPAELHHFGLRMAGD